MTRVPQGGDKVFNRSNVGRWMREHGGAAADYRELAELAAVAFSVETMLAGFEPGDACNVAWIWSVAWDVLAARGEGVRASAA
jgi:hypothetical protein